MEELINKITDIIVEEYMTPYEQAEKIVKYITDNYQALQLQQTGVSRSLKVGMQTFDLCDCPYQINTWIEKYNIQADNIISINQDSKQVVMFYKAFNDY